MLDVVSAKACMYPSHNVLLCCHDTDWFWSHHPCFMPHHMSWGLQSARLINLVYPPKSCDQLEFQQDVSHVEDIDISVLISYSTRKQLCRIWNESRNIPCRNCIDVQVLPYIYSKFLTITGREKADIYSGHLLWTPVYSVNRYRGGRKMDLISSVSEIQTQMWYHCI